MKQVTISTGNNEILVFDIPLEATEWGISPNGWFVWCNDKYDAENIDIELEGFKHGMNDIPRGNWKHLGKAAELSEEDWKGIVDDVLIGGIVGTMGAGGYWAYAAYDKSNLDGYKTATESGLSLLKGNGVVMENPRGEMPEKCSCRTGQSMCFVECGLSLQYAKWREAEEQVWVNPHVFIKID